MLKKLRAVDAGCQQGISRGDGGDDAAQLQVRPEREGGGGEAEGPAPVLVAACKSNTPCMHVLCAAGDAACCSEQL